MGVKNLFTKINVHYLDLGIPVFTSGNRQKNSLRLVYSISSKSNQILGYAITNSHPSERDKLILQCSTHMRFIAKPVYQACSASFTPWFPGKMSFFGKPPLSFGGRLWREIRPGDNQLLYHFTEIPLRYLRVIMCEGFLPVQAVERYIGEKVSQHNQNLGLTP